MAKVSLADKAYARIKEWIIEFRLKPGAHLSIGQLAEALDISRTPVREALSRLEQEYLVVRAPMKGFTVKGTDLKEIEDLFEVRTAIELLAVKQAAERINAENRKQLGDSLKTTARWVEKGEVSRSLQLEQSFHMKILMASGNIPLAEVGRGILGRIWAIQTFNIITSDMLAAAHEEHMAVFDSLSAGNSKAAEASMRKHLKHTTHALMVRLKDRNDIIHNAIAFDLTAWKQVDQKGS
jgi:DNA-binding GntR family transcriptional regulator